MKRLIISKALQSIMLISFAFALCICGTGNVVGATVARNPIVKFTNPTYSADGTNLTATLWMYNYDGDNANFVGDVYLTIDGNKVVKLNGIWSLLSNVTNEDNIKGVENSGSVASGDININGSKVGTAQFSNLRKNQKCSYNSNTSETKWSVVDLKLNFNPTFSYYGHAITIVGKWRDWCDDKNKKDKDYTFSTTLSGFTRAKDLSFNISGDKLNFAWTAENYNSNTKTAGKWSVYRIINGQKEKLGESLITDCSLSTDKSALTCMATYAATFTPSSASITDKDTISGLTAAFTLQDHTLDENDVCTTCQRSVFYYTTTDNNTIELDNSLDFGATLLTNRAIGNRFALEFDKPITKIPDRAFKNKYCFNGDLKIPSTVITIGEFAFVHANKEVCGTVVIPNSVKSIGANAFYGCMFTGLVLSNSLKKIEYGCFTSCSYLESVTIPESVVEIGGEAFKFCTRLKSVEFSTGLKTIGEWAFYDCSGLETIVLPQTLEYVASEAFPRCDNLKEVILQSNPRYIGQSAFNANASKSMSLSDDSYFAEGKTYSSDSASYTRNMPNAWGTLVLPFDVALSGNETYSLYTIKSMTNDELVLNPLSGTVKAGTPCIVKRSKDNATLTIEGANGNINSTTPTTVQVGNDLSLTGTYSAKAVTDGYIIANNNFWNVNDLKQHNAATNGVKVGPFRAWLAGNTANLSNQLSLRIDKDATGISDVDRNNLTDVLNAADIFDLNGKRQPALQRGINIVRTATGQVKKVIIK